MNCCPLIIVVFVIFISLLENISGQNYTGCIKFYGDINRLCCDKRLENNQTYQYCPTFPITTPTPTDTKCFEKYFDYTYNTYCCINVKNTNSEITYINNCTKSFPSKILLNKPTLSTDTKNCYSRFFNNYYRSTCCIKLITRYRLNYLKKYRTSISYPYYSTTTDCTTTTPVGTTSTSNDCFRYYYSYFYGTSCCQKQVNAYNPKYTSNYYYTTSLCSAKQSSTITPRKDITCSTYFYSPQYSTECCSFSYNVYNTHFCPTTNTLINLCPGNNCCKVQVPVTTAEETFYFYQYFCPRNSGCGLKCYLTISLGVLGACCCCTGLAISIVIFIHIGMHKPTANCQYFQMRQRRLAMESHVSEDERNNRPTYEEVVAMDLPPVISGYKYNPKLSAINSTQINNSYPTYNTDLNIQDGKIANEETKTNASPPPYPTDHKQ